MTFCRQYRNFKGQFYHCGERKKQKKRRNYWDVKRKSPSLEKGKKKSHFSFKQSPKSLFWFSNNLSIYVSRLQVLSALKKKNLYKYIKKKVIIAILILSIIFIFTIYKVVF